MRHALVLLALPALAYAQPSDGTPPPPPPGPPPAAMAPPPPPAQTGGPPAGGWQLQARMPTNLGTDSILSPGFTIGKRSGNIVFGVEVGITGGKFSTDNGAGSTNSDTVLLFSLTPLVYIDLWQSEDGRARLNALVGAGYGHGSITATSNDGMGGTSSDTSTVSYLPILGGIGGDYYLSKNFALGCELGAEIPVLLSVQDNNMDQHVSGNLESVHGLIRVTFVVGN
jgi:hypothetical protein